MAAEGNELHAIRAKRSPRELDAAIARLAARQHGVVTRGDMTALGLSRSDIERRVGGRLHRVHRGVYAVGHPRLTQEGRWLAAVFAAGDDAVLSHGSAARLWELRLGNEPRVEVTAPKKRRQQPGVRVHRAQLGPTEITTRNAIPVTSPLRTIFDLATQLDTRALEKLIREAEYHHLTTAAALTSRLSTTEHIRGSRKLATALQLAKQTTGRTESPLEDAFLAFLRKHKLPLPELNAKLRLPDGTEIRPDCTWRTQRVIAELDGASAHRTQHAFHADRARDLALQAAGWRPVRITRPQLRHHPDGLAAALQSLLR